MNIYWITARSFDDLCSTTQIELARGLLVKGHQLTFVNSDENTLHQTYPWSQIKVKQIGIRGLKSISLSHNIKKLVKENQFSCNVAIVDWRLASTVGPELSKKNIPWVLMDRSPPAYRGILAMLQWLQWKKSWRVANKYSKFGCTVSKHHSKFISDKCDSSVIEKIPLSAGVDLSLFTPRTENGKFTIIYHGRLDKNRGVLLLPLLSQKLIEADVDVKLLLIGEGDAWSKLHSITQTNDNIVLKKSVPTSEIASLIRQCDVGLLPMPETGVWTLASPLKRSEYAASGLAILGIDHSGHRLESGEVEWMKLVSQEQFLTEGIDWLKMLANDNSKLEQLKLQARQYAEENMSWSHSIDALEKVLKSVSQ